jgi:hypothetical protein
MDVSSQYHLEITCLKSLNINGQSGSKSDLRINFNFNGFARGIPTSPLLSINYLTSLIQDSFSSIEI